MAAQRVPVEIWQWILRYTIAVPVFFETDPIEMCGFQDFINLYLDETKYWRAERVRNILCRVCADWNIYLKRHEHRYVRFADVENGHVPPSAFAKAIRLRVEYRAPIESHGCDMQEQLLNQALTDQTEVWNLRILDGLVPKLSRIILGSGKPVYIAAILYIPQGLASSGHLPSNITFLDIWCLPAPSGHCTLTRLTTLILQELFIDDILYYSLPSLKHLSIQCIDELSHDPDNFLRFLRAVGTNLVTLLEDSELSDAILPDDIWTYCPNLEIFQTSFRLPFRLPVKPPLLRLPSNSFHEHRGFDSSRLPAEALYSAGVRLISFSSEWSSLLGWNAMEHVAYGMGYGLSFCDVRGVTFQDFIVGMLRYRKGPRVQPIPNWKRGHFVF
jgi:hypothetical protein